MTTERWIKVSEAARRLGVCADTVYRLCNRGRLSFYRDDETGSWRIDAVSLETYVRARTVSAMRITPEIAAVATRLKAVGQ